MPVSVKVSAFTEEKRKVGTTIAFVRSDALVCRTLL
jgi:hypothetical protein